VQIERLDPATDTSAVRACHEIHLAEWHADGVRRAPLSPRAFWTLLGYGWTEDPQEAWLARGSAGEVCGWYLLSLPERENQHRAGIILVVAPSRRRAGLGTALLGHAADRARQAGRTLLTGHSQQESARTAFARAIGARQRFTGVFWALRPRSLPTGRLAALRARAASAAAGYSLVSWEGPVADDRLAEVAALFDVEGDAPLPEGEDPPGWDPATSPRRGLPGPPRPAAVRLSRRTRACAAAWGRAASPWPP
jgi:GNAT superfamily N-acetyltransferase